ncbi:MAG: cupin domain-containing protein [Parasporobacterium sp.]|nr:cupin domain-containing protein [Parasporobacterium sp.]
MEKNPYIVRMNHPEDCICVHGSSAGPLEVRDITEPVDFTLKNEITCMIFHQVEEAKDDIECHAHTRGTETFIPVSGKMEITCNGYHTIMEPGDIIHMEPYMGHSFRAVEPGSSMLCLFQGFNMIKLMEDIRAARALEPDIMQNPDFHEQYLTVANKILRKVPAPIEVPKDQIPCLYEEGKGQYEYNAPGIRLLLKIGKWQTAGQREMWEADMKKGVKITWNRRYPDFRLFHIRGGKIELTVDNNTYIVDEEAIIHIPPFHAFAIKALEDSVVYDLDCSENMAGFLEDLGDISEAVWPENDEYFNELISKFRISVSSYEYKPE